MRHRRNSNPNATPHTFADAMTKLAVGRHLGTVGMDLARLEERSADVYTYGRPLSRHTRRLHWEVAVRSAIKAEAAYVPSPAAVPSPDPVTEWMAREAQFAAEMPTAQTEVA